MKDMNSNELSTNSTDSQLICGEVSQPENGEWTSLEQYGYIAVFTITSNSDWVIEPEGDWFVVYQTKGTGTSKIQVEIVENSTDMQRDGKITIKFPQDEQKNQTINVKQKSLADYNANDLTISEGYSRYGVGYGYDATGSYASSVSCKSQVFLVGKMIADEKVTMDGSIQEVLEQTYTGVSVSNVSQKLSVKAGVEAKYGGFKGEVKASFDQECSENECCEFGIHSYNDKKGFRRIEETLQNLKADYMAPIARKAIDGESELYKDEEGIKRLIQAYGTHVISRASMGGRLDYSMAVDVSKIDSNYKITAFLSVGYDGLLKASASADEKYKKSYEANKKNCYVKVRTLGGGVSAAYVLENGKDGMKKWVDSLDDSKNHAMVDFDADSLVPIWELCVDKERAEKIKQYVELYVRNMGQPTTSKVNKIDIPNFSTAPDATLVKTAVLEDGTPVAEICNEYIPNLSSTTRVTVVYPILAGAPQYGFGYFVGSLTHNPGFISWDEDKYTYREDSDFCPATDSDSDKVVKTVYCQGLITMTNVSLIPKVQIRKTTITDQFLVTLRGFHDTILVNHPLVKVSNCIWTRVALWTTVSSDNMVSFGYSTRLSLGGAQWVEIETAGLVGTMLYNRTAADHLQSFKWTLPSKNDCISLIKYVEKEASKIISGGVSGLELYLCGFWSAYSKSKVGQRDEGSIWCGTGFEYFRIIASRVSVGTVESKVNGDNTYGFPVRLTRVATFRYY